MKLPAIPQYQKSLDQVRDQLFSKNPARKKFLATLTQNLEYGRDVLDLPRVPETRAIRKAAKKTVNLVESMLRAVDQKTHSQAEIKKMWRDASDIVGSVLNYVSQEADDQERDDAIADNSKNLLQKLKAKHARALPSTLRNSFQVVEVPIMASFDRVGVDETLRSYGFKATQVDIGLRRKGAGSVGMGFLIEGQYLLCASRKELTDLAEEEIAEARNSSESRRIGAQMRNVKKRISSLEEDIAGLQKKKATAVTRKLITEKQAKIDEMQGTLTQMESNKAKAAKHLTLRVRNARRQDFLFNGVKAAVDQINEQSSVKYILVSDVPVANPRNKDIIMYWIMPKSMYQAAHRLHDFKVSSWSLPWAK